jgi:hypothetical protein
VAGHDQNAGGRELGPQLLDDLESVQAGKEKIHHHQAGLLLQAKIESGAPIGESPRHDHAAQTAQRHRQHPPENLLVLNDDCSRGHSVRSTA